MQCKQLPGTSSSPILVRIWAQIRLQVNNWFTKIITTPIIFNMYQRKKIWWTFFRKNKIRIKKKNYKKILIPKNLGANFSLFAEFSKKWNMHFLALPRFNKSSKYWRKISVNKEMAAICPFLNFWKKNLKKILMDFFPQEQNTN